MEPRTSRHLATGFFSPRSNDDFVHFVGSQFRDPKWKLPVGRDDHIQDFVTPDFNDHLDEEGNINYYKGKQQAKSPR